MVAMRLADPGATQAKVLALITWTCQQFNVTNNMNPNQMAVCAQEIVDTVVGLNLDDIDLCFRMAVRGDYGEIYNRIDTPTIFGWLKKYRGIRMDKAEELNKQAIETNNIYEIMSHPQVLESVKQVAEKFDADRKPEPEPVKERQYSPLEAQILNEWDANDDNSMQGSYKRFNGTYYSFTDYANMRAKQIAEIQQHNKTNENEND